MKNIQRYKQFIPAKIKTLNHYLQRRPVNKIFAKLNVSHAVQIPTHTTQDELEALFWLANSLPFKAQALEIGSYLGASTCFIAAALAGKDGHLFCVDTWNNETMPEGERDTYSEFMKNTAPLKPWITPIRKDSRQLTAIDVKAKISFVFIDGDHSYSSVKGDFSRVLQMLAEPPIIAFHDSLFYSGVSKVIGEALASGEWAIGGLCQNLFWINRYKG